MHIDHTTLRTTRLEETRDFFIKVFDMVEGPRPAIIAANIEGFWMYHHEAPLVHLIKSNTYAESRQGYTVEAIDHTAFYMDIPYELFKSKLESLELKFSLMDLPDIGERRIFLHTPTGILLEAVFRTSLQLKKDG